MCPQMAWTRRCIVTLVTFVWFNEISSSFLQDCHIWTLQTKVIIFIILLHCHCCVVFCPTMAIFPFGNFLRDPRPLSAIVSIRWHSLCFLFSQSCFYVYCPGSLLLVLLLSCLPCPPILIFYLYFFLFHSPAFMYIVWGVSCLSSSCLVLHWSLNLNNHHHRCWFWRNGLIRFSTFLNLVKNFKFGRKFEIWLNFEISLKKWNLVKIVKFDWN